MSRKRRKKRGLKLGCDQREFTQAVACDGYVIVPRVFGDNDVQRMRALVDDLPADDAVRTRRGAAYGVRNLFALCPELRSMLLDGPVQQMASENIGDGAFVTRAILFDKQPEANWSIRWHQDVAIAVRERREAKGFGPWSEKAGVIHVRPPREVLEGMVAARIHLDDCEESNGALRVVPGSHAHGMLSPDRTAEMRKKRGVHVCEARAGDVLLMRPLILHASSAAENPIRRRVIHLEFAARALPYGLDWNLA